MPFLAETWADPVVTATLGGTRSEVELHLAMPAWDEHWNRYGYGIWVLTDEATGERVGWALLRHVEFDGVDEVEVGWTTVASRWGEGLAPEAAAEVIRMAFEEAALDSVVSMTLHDNQRSRRVMDKLGFTYEKEVVHAGLPHVLYRLRRQV